MTGVPGRVHEAIIKKVNQERRRMDWKVEDDEGEEGELKNGFERLEGQDSPGSRRQRFVVVSVKDAKEALSNTGKGPNLAYLRKIFTNIVLVPLSLTVPPANDAFVKSPDDVGASQ